MALMTIETERLILKKPSGHGEDSEFVISFLKEATIIDNAEDMWLVKRIEAEQQHQHSSTESNRKNGYLTWIIIEKSSMQKIGLCSLLKRDYLETPDISCALLPTSRSKGYARETIASTLCKLKKRLGLTEVSILTKPQNRKLIALLDFLDFTLHNTVFLPNRFPPILVYRKCL